MKTCNRCYTYFKMVGRFNPDDITHLLKLQPEQVWKTGDNHKNGSKYDFDIWTIGCCDDYDIEVSNQMKKTISPLLDKIDL